MATWELCVCRDLCEFRLHFSCWALGASPAKVMGNGTSVRAEALGLRDKSGLE